MKCLDTPLLEDLLLGRPRARKWLARFGKDEGETAATEVSFAELTEIARGQGRAAERHLEALAALRRELTVLPFDAESQRAMVRLAVKSRHDGGDLLPLMVAGTALAKGVSHVLTDGKRRFPREVAPLKIVRL